MRFKDWLLKETGTSTSCIAGFSRMTLPLVTRQWPLEVAFQMEVPNGKRKKKPKDQPQVKD